MNTTDFEKLVRPYLHPDIKNSNILLVMRNFKEHKIPVNKKNYIIEENKLIYIPGAPTYNETQYFVFSDESNMYCWSSGSNKLDIWKHLETGWDCDYHWIHKKIPISNMNYGRGWDMGDEEEAFYYTLEIIPLNFINWTNDNPLEEKL